MTAKFIHTADWQIGKNYDRISDDSKRERLRRARLETLVKLGEIARQKNAEFILVAGDLFDSPTSDKSTVAAALGAIGKLALPVIAIPGNHDHGGPGGLWELPFFKEQQKLLAPNFTILLHQTPFETEKAWILPCPLLRRSESTDPTAWIREADFENLKSGSKPVILLAHGSTQSFVASSYDDEEGEEGCLNRIDLNRLPFGLVDYVALGDWHGTKTIENWARYSGTHEPDRFTKGGDHDPGNVLFVEVARSSPPAVEKISTATIAWHGMEFDFIGDESLDVFDQSLEQIVGTRVDEDLLQLDLSGSLGLESSARLAAKLDSLAARLLRLKLRNKTRVEATPDEIAALTTRASDPLIAHVASSLVEQSTRQGNEAATAAVALQELFAAVHASNPSQSNR